MSNMELERAFEIVQPVLLAPGLDQPWPLMTPAFLRSLLDGVRGAVREELAEEPARLQTRLAELSALETQFAALTTWVLRERARHLVPLTFRFRAATPEDDGAARVAALAATRGAGPEGATDAALALSYRQALAARTLVRMDALGAERFADLQEGVRIVVALQVCQRLDFAPRVPGFADVLAGILPPLTY